MNKINLGNRWQKSYHLHRWGVLRGANYLRAVDQEFCSFPDWRGKGEKGDKANAQIVTGISWKTRVG